MGADPQISEWGNPASLRLPLRRMQDEHRPSSFILHPSASHAPAGVSSLQLVEVNGIEPMTPCLQSRCSPS